MGETIKKVSIITVNFNQPAVTESLLHSIAQTNRYPNIEIIVVDNGSKEDHTVRWTIQYPTIQFIRSDRNLGFAGGNNLGIAAATGDYFFLVNNDTEFTEGLVSVLVDTLEQNPGIGMVSPKIRYFDAPQVLQYAGFTPLNYCTARNRCIGQFETDHGQYDAVTGPTAFAHGAAMMVRRAAIEKAGLMFDNYFLYYEELDWCERIRKAGFSIWIQMQALVYHKESVSVGQKSALKEYFMNRNRLLFIRRNANAWQRFVFYCYFLLVVSPRNCWQYLRMGKPSFILQLCKAIGWNITHPVNSDDTGWHFK
jgi:GT2 family glycosyltransferase